MIFSMVVLLLLIVFLAFFIGKNLSNVCTFWIFKTFTDLPVAILALISFGVGIVVSMLIFLLAKLKKAAKEDRIAEAKESVIKEQNKVKKEIRKLEKKNKKLGHKKNDKAGDQLQDNTIIQEDTKHE